MNLNATLFGQFITFTFFVWVTMKWVWPLIHTVLEERKKTIADGLAAAELSQRELANTKEKIASQLTDAKANASDLLDQANKRAALLIEEAKGKARIEGQRLVDLAKADIDQQLQSIKDQLRKQVAGIAVSGAEKILERDIDEKAHAALLDKLVKEI